MRLVQPRVDGIAVGHRARVAAQLHEHVADVAALLLGAGDQLVPALVHEVGPGAGVDHHVDQQERQADQPNEGGRDAA